MNKSLKGYFNYTRKDLADLILPNKYERVLEIGCGAGSFTENYRDGCEKWGVEPVEIAASAAKKMYSNVLTGFYRDIESELPDYYFDLVVCNDVIEHMPDADLFLVDIQRKMTANGVMIGSIPNVRHYRNLFQLLFGKDWKYTSRGVLDHTHQRFFTEKSLKRTFGETGWSIDVLQGIGSLFSTRARIVSKHTLKKICVLILMALGHSDTRFLQFAFKIKKINQSRAHS